MTTTPFILTRTNANGIRVCERTWRDSQVHWQFDLTAWELGLRAARHDDEMERRRIAQREVQQRLYGREATR